MISIYDKKCTDFNNNGLVVLSDCKSCYIEEKLNDSYELTLEYPIDERGKWQYLTEKNIIKADGQLFRIYHKVKDLTSITVNARHIFYDLMDNFLEDVKISGLSGLTALDWILSHTQYSHPFICTGDVGGSATADYVKKNVVEAIMSSDSSDSQQNSLLVNYGGELVRDNFTIGYWEHRGQDRGTTIRYGKNITGIEETLDMDNVVTRVMPTGKDGLLLDERYIDSSLINNYPHPIVKSVEFSDDDTQDKLRASAQQYLQSGVDQPAVNYEIDFIELTKTEEYKNYSVLESVYLGDTVTVKHERLGIDLKAEVIRVKKNVLTGRIEEVELGSFKHDLSSTFSSISNSYDNLQDHVNKVNDNLQEQIDGKIETYFTDADPHTWPTSDNTAHNGDMWYKTGTKQLFRFNGSDNAWDEMENQKAIDAYNAASEAQDTADGKRRVFTVTPTPPYDKGDLWSQGAGGDIMVCQTPKSTGQSYSTDDWVKASKYTDDSAINSFINGIYKTDKENLQCQIDGNIMTWFYSGIPALNNVPASNWTDDTAKSNHLGDIYYDTAENENRAYRFALINSVYQWVLINDTDVTTALANAAKAQDTADHKRRVFVTTPAVPYDVGDLWMQGSNGDSLVCQTAKGSSGAYNASDWVKASKYTDDTAVNSLQIGVRNLIRSFSNWMLGNGVIHSALYNGFDVLEKPVPSSGFNDSVVDFLAEPNTVYTFSLWIKGDIDIFLVPMKTTDASWTPSTVQYQDNYTNINGGSDYTYHTFQTQVTPSDTVRIRLGIRANAGVTTDAFISKVKVEKGTKATDYTEAPEDTQNQINSINSSISDMSNDNRLTPEEKQLVKKDLDAITQEKTQLDNQSSAYGITTELTNYDASYTTLYNYVNPLVSDLTTTSNVIGATLRNDFSDYFNKRTALQNKIADTAASLKAEAIRIGVRNLLSTQTAFQNGNSQIGNQIYVGQSISGFTFKFPIGTDWISCGFHMVNILKPNTDYTISFLVWTDGDGDGSTSTLCNDLCPDDLPEKDLTIAKGSIQRINWTLNSSSSNMTNCDFRFFGDINSTMYISDVIMVEGNKAPTNWSPAPEDIQSQINDLNNFVDVTYTQDKTNLQKAVDNATSQMNSALGGYVLKRNSELLIMDTQDVNTATKVWRWDQNGLGYSSTGYNGPYKTAITADGKVVATAITTGILTGITIQTGKSGARLVETGNTLTTYNESDKPILAIGGSAGSLAVYNNSGTLIATIGGGTGTSGFEPAIISPYFIKGGTVVGDYLKTSNGEVMMSSYGNYVMAPEFICDTLRGESDADKIELGNQDTGKCRIDTSSGVLRLYTSAYGSADTGLKINPSGEVDIMRSSNSYPVFCSEPNSLWSGTIPATNGVTITHNLGHYPIVATDGTVGNINLTFQNLNSNQLKVWNSTSNAWSGGVRMW